MVKECNLHETMRIQWWGEDRPCPFCVAMKKLDELEIKNARLELQITEQEGTIAGLQSELQATGDEYPCR